MSSTRSRALLAAAALLSAATALTATMAGPVQASPAPAAGVPALPRSTPAPSVPPSSSAPTAPGPLTGLRVTGVTPTSITLSWDPVVPGCCAISRYQIGYKLTFNDVWQTKSVPNVTTATLTEGITPNGQYSLFVYATDENGQNSVSSTLTVVTPAGTTGDVTAPTAPTGLTITGNTPGGAPLSWSPSTDDVGVTGYNIYHFDGLFISTLVATSTGTSAIAPLRYSATNNGQYYVRARDAAGNLSIASNTVRAPQGPASPSASASATPPPAVSCTFSYQVTSQWAGGFLAQWTVTNTGSTAVDNWRVVLRFAGDELIVSGWGATYSQSGSAVTLTGSAWNRSIPPGGKVSGGFIGRGTPAMRPLQLLLNGVACTPV